MKGKIWDITEKEDLEKVAIELAGEHYGAAGGRAVVFALYGDLGAGKTTFTQALGQALGIESDITSPTFVLMKRYDVPGSDGGSLIHIDAYRLESPSELEVLGFYEWVKEERALIVIEWADRVESLLPEDTIRLNFELKDANRTLELIAS